MNKLLEINKILRNLDEEDLNLVYVFVNRLFESYEDVSVQTQVENQKEVSEVSNESNLKADVKESVQSLNSDAVYEDILDTYESLGSEELLERLMMWKRY